MEGDAAEPWAGEALARFSPEGARVGDQNQKSFFFENELADLRTSPMAENMVLMAAVAVSFRKKMVLPI